MKTILLSSLAIVAVGAIATTAAWDTAHAASRFDGSWTGSLRVAVPAIRVPVSVSKSTMVSYPALPAVGYLIVAPFASASPPEARMQVAVDACPQAPEAALGAV